MEADKTLTILTRTEREIPAIGDGDNAGSVQTNLEEHWHGEVEVLSWRITPSTVITRLRKIRRTKVRCRHENRRIPGDTPSRVVRTLKLEASAAAETIVEQRSA